MKRYALLAATAVVGGAVAFQGSVNLQATTPGSPQTGHLNVTGTAKAGFFKGNGNQLTNLNGSALNTGIITLTGASSTYIIRGTNSAGSANASALIGIATSPTGVTYGTWAETKSTSGRALFGYASAPSGATYGSYAINNSNAGRAAFGLAQSVTGNTYGGWFQSNSPAGVGSYARNIAGGVGLRAESTGRALEVLGNATVSGTVGIGTNSPNSPVHIVTDQSTAIRVEGTNTTGQSTIGHFSTASDVGNAIFANATSATGTAAGVRGYSNAANGYGVFAQNGSPTGFALFGQGNAGITGNLGIGTGTTSPTTRLEIIDDALYPTVHVKNGLLTLSPGTTRFGLVAQTGGPGGNTAVMGIAESTSSQSSIGVYGFAAGNGATFGVYGDTLGGTTAYAGYFLGLLYANSASAGVKSFMIDHPMDPANKVLMHSSVESDERMNLYRGVLTTDSQGFASASVPAWFDALNEDIQYQLTVIGDESADFVSVKVAKELRNGKFKIRTSFPNTKVNWMLSGRRHDPTSNYYPLEVERMKNKDEKGKYYVPEAYSKDKSLGMGYVPTQEASAKPKAK